DHRQSADLEPYHQARRLNHRRAALDGDHPARHDFTDIRHRLQVTVRRAEKVALGDDACKQAGPVDDGKPANAVSLHQTHRYLEVSLRRDGDRWSAHVIANDHDSSFPGAGRATIRSYHGRAPGRLRGHGRSMMWVKKLGNLVANRKYWMLASRTLPRGI